jgi:hypothetical protein
MANISFLKKQTGVTDNLKAMVGRAKDVRSYLDTVVVRQYQKAQLARWQTEGASEGMPWAPLTLPYAKYKAKKHAGDPGDGKVLMIATGKLSEAATLASMDAVLKVVTSTGITIGIDSGVLAYARYAGNMRPFMQFSDQTISDMRAGLKNYIKNGSLSWRAS